MKAGKSVLILDQTDIYGSDFASFTYQSLFAPDSIVIETPQKTKQDDSDSKQSVIPTDATLIQIPRPRLPIHGLASLNAIGHDFGPARSYILDLAPKVWMLSISSFTAPSCYLYLELRP